MESQTTYPIYTSPGEKRNIVEGLEIVGHERGQCGAMGRFDLGKTIIDAGTEVSEGRVVTAPQGVLLHEFPQPLDQIEIR